MNISPEDKHTPIKLLANSSLHLNGANRPIGLFFVGSSGIRIFCPNPVASSFVSIGGMSILLCLVAMVTELGELYAALKALTCILQSSRIARREMNRVHGYQVRKKKICVKTLFHSNFCDVLKCFFGHMLWPEWLRHYSCDLKVPSLIPLPGISFEVTSQC